MTEATCWGCTKHAETGLAGFVQDGCPQCMEREVTNSPRLRWIEREAIAIAESEAGRQWEGKPEGLVAAMRKQWPIESEYRAGRVAVWNWIKRRAANEA